MSGLGVDDIFAKTDGGLEIFKKYIPNLTVGGAICSPLRPDQKPSFSIFKSSDNKYLYKDHATGESGNAMQFVQKLFGLDFTGALNKIKTEMGFGYPKIDTVPVKFQKFSDPELGYWAKYGITKEVLDKFKVKSVESYRITSREGKSFEIQRKKGEFIFGYPEIGAIKIYKPLETGKYKFQFVGKRDSSFIFGWEQLPEQGEMVFITSGNKDAMSLWSKGYGAIAFNSETANIPETVISELKRRFKRVIILYDNDVTGQNCSKKQAIKHKIFRLELPHIEDGKDISDYFKSGKVKEDFEELLKTRVEAVAQPKNENQVVFDAIELLESATLEPDYLLSPLLPRVGTGVIVGPPDTGKSQFARLLCLSVANKIQSFLNLVLKIIFGKAIYVATEDDKDSIASALKKQFDGLKATPNHDLRIILGDTMTPTDLQNHLQEELLKDPADLVVIDSFGDIFQGQDSNNNMAMRNTVKEYDRIAKKFGCLVLFVHHINKSAYDSTPGQRNIQGGSGLSQKVRIALQLSPGPENIKFLSVLKGNYTPSEYKKTSIELEFSEKDFLFTCTGRTVQTDEIGQKSQKKEKYLSELKIQAEKILGESELTYSEFCNKIIDITGKSEATAKRLISSCDENNIVEKTAEKKYKIRQIVE